MKGCGSVGYRFFFGVSGFPFRYSRFYELKKQFSRLLTGKEPGVTGILFTSEMYTLAPRKERAQKDRKYGVRYGTVL